MKSSLQKNNIFVNQTLTNLEIIFGKSWKIFELQMFVEYIKFKKKLFLRRSCTSSFFQILITYI